MEKITCGADEFLTDFGCIPDNPAGLVSRYYSIGLAFIGLLGLIYLIVGGYHILVSRGDPQMLQKGKSFITYAIIGILLAIFGFIFIQIVTANILQLPGFS